MQFSENWLRTMVSPPVGSAELCHALTMAGLEVEDSRPAAPPFDRVVVARVEDVEPHPNADRLRVCRVDVGSGEAVRVVCGAPNVAAGQRVPCALPGASLPGGVQIREANVRGVASSGMLCSGRELGISDDASGLLVLPADAPVGSNLRDYLDLDDTIVTLKLTPNRADCLSLLGIAREVSAITQARLEAPEFESPPTRHDGARRVRIEDFGACPRFCARVIRGIDPSAPTPAWMVRRLERSGIRSISAVVDVTNYVMVELGQPLHAYDSRVLEGDVVVRWPRPQEKLTLLNGQTLDLEPDMLLVADENKPLGLAGIMGGEHSGINDQTTEVFLEGAFWNPAAIQGRSRRLGFSSDAGHRFERGVDFGATARAVDRAAGLIVEICGGECGPLIDARGELPARPAVTLRRDRATRILGVEIPADAIGGILQRLGLGYARHGDVFEVTPPSYRFDIAIEEDLIEEVARILGYERIAGDPPRHVQQMLHDTESARSPWDVRDRMVARDYQEVVTFSFVENAWEADFAGNDRPIRLLNPIASHLDVMRSTLAGSLADVLRTNVARKQTRVRIFEVGRCFLGSEAQPTLQTQPLRIGGLAYGPATEEQWGTPSRGTDFFDVKADLEALAAPSRLTTRAAAHPALHPGRSARVTLDGTDIGWMGEMHPRLQRKYELPAGPILFELDLAPLLRTRRPHAQPVSKFPPVRRDIAIVIDESVSAQTLLDTLEAARSSVVSTVRVFDVYRGSGVPQGKKSLAILVLMQDTQRTLTDAEIEENVTRLVGVLQREFGATLRQ